MRKGALGRRVLVMTLVAAMSIVSNGTVLFAGEQTEPEQQAVNIEESLGTPGGVVLSRRRKAVRIQRGRFRRRMLLSSLPVRKMLFSPRVP